MTMTRNHKGLLTLVVVPIALSACNAVLGLEERTLQDSQTASTTVSDGGAGGASTDQGGAGGQACGGMPCVELGKSCKESLACSSGVCVDGVCCDQPCDGVCMSCNVTGSEGSCSMQTAGQPDSSCAVGVCDGSGSCATGSHRWSGGFGDADLQTAVDVAVDDAGNTIVVGDFEGEVSFGGDTHVCGGGTDIFVAKFDADGKLLFSKRLGSEHDQQVAGVAVDKLGTIVLVGSTTGDVDFGGGIWPVSGGTDAFVVKLDSSGAHVFSLVFGDESNQWGHDVAVDAAGKIFVSGLFAGSVKIGNEPLLATGPYADLFVAQFDAAGLHQWSKGFGSTLNLLAGAMAVDSGGDLVIVGAFTGDLDLAGGSPLSNLDADADVFVVKLTGKDGAHVWSKGFGVRGEANSVAIDAADAVVVAGVFQGEMTFGTDVLTSVSGWDVFLGKLDSSGTASFAKRYADDGTDKRPPKVAVDSAANILLTGGFEGAVNLGGKPLNGEGLEDIFVAKLDTTGSHIWSRRFGDSYQDTVQDLAVASSGAVSLVGSFWGDVDFGGETLSSAGDWDVFAASLAP